MTARILGMTLRGLPARVAAAMGTRPEGRMRARFGSAFVWATTGPARWSAACPEFRRSTGRNNNNYRFRDPAGQARDWQNLRDGSGKGVIDEISTEDGNDGRVARGRRRHQPDQLRGREDARRPGDPVAGRPPGIRSTLRDR